MELCLSGLSSWDEGIRRTLGALGSGTAELYQAGESTNGKPNTARPSSRTTLRRKRGSLQPVSGLSSRTASGFVQVVAATCCSLGGGVE